MGRVLGAAGQDEVGAKAASAHDRASPPGPRRPARPPWSGRGGSRGLGAGGRRPRGAAAPAWRRGAGRRLGLRLVGALAGQGREAQQAQRRRGVARGDRVVADLLAAGDQRFVVVGGREEAAALGVAEAGDHRVGERQGLLEPALLEGRFVEGEQGLEQEGVVLQVGVEAAPRRPCRCAAGGPRRRAASRAGTRRSGAPPRGSRGGRAPRPPRRGRLASSAFQAVRRLSSRPGRTRFSRASRRARRASARPAGSRRRRAARQVEDVAPLEVAAPR